MQRRRAGPWLGLLATLLAMLSPAVLRALPATLKAVPARKSMLSCIYKAPRELRLARLRGPRIRLSWKAPSGAVPNAYRVLLSGRTVGQTEATYMVLSVILGHRTGLTVEARYARVPSACAARLRVELPFRAPNRVTGLRIVTQGSSSVTIGWHRAKGRDAPVIGYRIMKDGAVVGQTKARTFTMTISQGRAHRIDVGAVDSRGQVGPLSKALLIGAKHSGASAHGTGTGIPPSAPGALSVSDVSDLGATVWWVPSQAGSARIVGYRVYRDDRLVSQTNRDYLRLTNLASAQTYLITVSAIDADHRESPRTPALRLTTTHTAPQGPSEISALRVTDTSATLSWQAGAANSGTLVGYLLFKDGAAVKVVDGQIATVTLASDRRYTFTVRAMDSWGYLSAPAPAVTVITTHTPPSTPTGLQASDITEDSANLGWSASTAVSGEIVGYRVFRNDIPVGQSSTLTMALNDLAPSTEYEMTVVAVDSLGAISAPTTPLAVHTAEPPPTHGHVQAFLLASTDESFEDFEAHYQQIGVVYPTYYNCGRGGSITGSDVPLVTEWAQARKVEVLPRLNCQEPTFEDEILNDPSVGQSMIEGLASLCRTYGYQGIQVDFEGAQPAERSPFTSFITALAEKLHSQGDKLSTVVTAKYYNVQTGRAAMYDDAALSGPSDYVFVLDWGLHWTTSTPGAMDDLPWSTKVADYTATLPNKSKFILGLPLYGIDWPNGGGPSNPGTPLEYASIMALATEENATPEWEPTAAAPHFSYVDANGVQHSVWYTDQQSLNMRLELAHSLGLGVGLWRLGTEDQSIWELPGLEGSG